MFNCSDDMQQAAVTGSSYCFLNPAISVSSDISSLPPYWLLLLQIATIQLLLRSWNRYHHGSWLLTLEYSIAMTNEIEARIRQSKFVRDQLVKRIEGILLPRTPFAWFTEATVLGSLIRSAKKYSDMQSKFHRLKEELYRIQLIESFVDSGSNSNQQEGDMNNIMLADIDTAVISIAVFTSAVMMNVNARPFCAHTQLLQYLRSDPQGSTIRPDRIFRKVVLNEQTSDIDAPQHLQQQQQQQHTMQRAVDADFDSPLRSSDDLPSNLTTNAHHSSKLQGNVTKLCVIPEDAQVYPADIASRGTTTTAPSVSTRMNSAWAESDVTNTNTLSASTVTPSAQQSKDDEWLAKYSLSALTDDSLSPSVLYRSPADRYESRRADSLLLRLLTIWYGFTGQRLSGKSSSTDHRVVTVADLSQALTCHPELAGPLPNCTNNATEAALVLFVEGLSVKYGCHLVDEFLSHLTHIDETQSNPSHSNASTSPPKCQSEEELILKGTNNPPIIAAARLKELWSDLQSERAATVSSHRSLEDESQMQFDFLLESKFLSAVDVSRLQPGKSSDKFHSLDLVVDALFLSSLRSAMISSPTNKSASSSRQSMCITESAAMELRLADVNEAIRVIPKIYQALPIYIRADVFSAIELLFGASCLFQLLWYLWLIPRCVNSTFSLNQTVNDYEDSTTALANNSTLTELGPGTMLTSDSLAPWHCLNLLTFRCANYVLVSLTQFSLMVLVRRSINETRHYARIKNSRLDTAFNMLYNGLWIALLILAGPVFAVVLVLNVIPMLTLYAFWFIPLSAALILAFQILMILIIFTYRSCMCSSLSLDEESDHDHEVLESEDPGTTPVPLPVPALVADEGVAVESIELQDQSSKTSGGAKPAHLKVHPINEVSLDHYSLVNLCRVILQMSWCTLPHNVRTMFQSWLCCKSLKNRVSMSMEGSESGSASHVLLSHPSLAGNPLLTWTVPHLPEIQVAIHIPNRVAVTVLCTIVAPIMCCLAVNYSQFFYFGDPFLQVIANEFEMRRTAAFFNLIGNALNSNIIDPIMHLLVAFI